MRSKRITLILLLLPVLAGSAALWLRAQRRQYALNRRLIRALQAGNTNLANIEIDDKHAFALINEGADSNIYFTEMPPPTLADLVAQMFYRPSSRRFPAPTALMIACGALIPSPYDSGKVGMPHALNLVETMLRHSAHVNAQDSKRQTALMRAVDNPDHMRMLLRYGANVNIRDDNGCSPLQLTINKDAVRLLVEQGADVNNKDVYGTTPLMQAARNVQPWIVSWVLRHGAYVNAQDNNRQTSLSIAVGCCDKWNRTELTEIVRQLLEYGADPNLPDNSGDTPLGLAQIDDCSRYLVPLLKRYGAKK